MVGRLEKVELRKVWIKEAKDFTTWRENNLDILSEHIGFDLSPLEREKSAGTFSADIFAEGPNGDTVVINKIEEQFGEPLIWDKIEGRRVCRIKSICEVGGLKDTDLWDQIQKDLIDRMIRLEKALRPALSTIK